MIVDDDVVIAMGLQELLSSKGYEVVGIVDSAVEAINRARDLQPDLILMDIKLPGELDGIDAAEKIMKEHDIPVIFVTGYSDEGVIERAKRLNPLGYITKPFNEEQVPAAIEIGVQNKKKEERILKLAKEREPANIESRFCSELLTRYPELTTQELKIAKLVREGKSTKEIAELLYVCEETVLWHRKNIRRKMGISKKNTSLMAALSYAAKEPSPR